VTAGVLGEPEPVGLSHACVARVLQRLAPGPAAAWSNALEEWAALAGVPMDHANAATVLALAAALLLALLITSRA
jgi:hypothetical protein